MNLLKTISRASLVVALSTSMVVAGCSTTWVTTLDNILIVAAPALINILNIISVVQGVPVNTALESKITGDVAVVKTLATEFSSASTAASPAVCSQLEAAINTYGVDEQQVISLVPVNIDPATQQKIAILSGLVATTVSSILAVVPQCQTAAGRRAMFQGVPPLPVSTFIKTYNTELVKPTGNAAVDKFTKGRKVHAHGKFLRYISAGLVK